ncbi:MAG: hypothetical protein LBG47_08770 [Prevotellaceae bacterium]|jgi:uncharacterized protein with PQ loop repeat|nr:hypothetical protein [Prevotellaceae bacterium]
MIVDVIGYLAPAVLVASFFFKNVATLRCVNTVGCILFIAYGLLIAAYPVAIANAIIAIANGYHLTRRKARKS